MIRTSDYVHISTHFQEVQGVPIIFNWTFNLLYKKGFLIVTYDVSALTVLLHKLLFFFSYVIIDWEKLILYAFFVLIIYIFCEKNNVY
jgi:hypothetical protein